MRLRFACALLLATLPACSAWFFSGEFYLDRTHPAVLVETTGGVELGCATEYGILTLGRTATSGPCLVHYFLGTTPLVEAGQLQAPGGMFALAEIDLKTPRVRVLDRPVAAEDDLVVAWTPDGERRERLAVRLWRDPAVRGDVLQDPGRALPCGAAVLRVVDGDTVQFVGLVTGRATLAGPGGTRSGYVFAGPDRVRELLALPRPLPETPEIHYRVDDVSVQKVPAAPPPAAAPESGGPPESGRSAPRR
jgi:hypothetical protein